MSVCLIRHQGMKICGEVIKPHIFFNFSIRWKCVVSFVPLSLCLFIQYIPTKCTFCKLIYYFLIFDVFDMFRTRGFTFRKTVIYAGTVRYGVVCCTCSLWVEEHVPASKTANIDTCTVQHTIPYLYIQSSS